MLEDINGNRTESPAAKRAGEDKIPPSPAVERYGGKGLIHRDDGMSKTPDPHPVTDYSFDRIAEHDTDIFDGVVAVHVQVTLRSTGKVKTPVFCHGGEHVVKNGTPLSTVTFPAPSGFRVSTIFVSFVSRFMVTFLIDFPPVRLSALSFRCTGQIRARRRMHRRPSDRPHPRGPRLPRQPRPGYRHDR